MHILDIGWLVLLDKFVPSRVCLEKFAARGILINFKIDLSPSRLTVSRNSLRIDLSSSSRTKRDANRQFEQFHQNEVLSTLLPSTGTVAQARSSWGRSFSENKKYIFILNQTSPLCPYHPTSPVQTSSDLPRRRDGRATLWCISIIKTIYETVRFICITVQ